MFADTHAHLYSEYYDNIDFVINDANNRGIKYIINAGIDANSNKEVLELSSKYPNLYCVLGVHPEDVDTYYDADLQFIIDNLNNPKVVGIGEIGLDYYYTKENKEKQKEIFCKQLEVAEKYNLPVVVHSREATQDTIDCLKKYKVKGVIHAFSGSLDTANIYIKMGFKLGVGGVVTFKNSKLKEVFKEVDISNIVFETDSPYLSPEPLRGRVNNPGNVDHIVKFISELKNVSIEELSKVSMDNVRYVFDKIHI
jgi:TatD DNase family protein